MPFTGATFNLVANDFYPAVEATVIDPDASNEMLEDLANGLTACVTRDGSGSMSGNLAMASHKITGLSAGSANGDSVRYEQAQLVSAVATAWEGLSWSANKLGYATGASAFALTDLTVGGRLVLATTFTDPGADRIFGWDDSAGFFIGYTVGTGLAFNGTAIELSANLQSWSAIAPGTSAAKDTATAAEVRANTADKVLETDTTWAAAEVVTLTDAATIAVDMSTFINAIVTLGDNRTLGQPSNTKVGQSGFIRIVQDGVGTRTLAFHTDWKFANGLDPTLTTTAGATDILFYEVIAANFIFASLVTAVA